MQDYLPIHIVWGFNKLIRTRISSLKDEIYKLEDMLIICNM